MGLFREGSAHSEAQKEVAQMASSSLEIKDVPKVAVSVHGVMGKIWKNLGNVQQKYHKVCFCWIFLFGGMCGVFVRSEEIWKA